MDKLKQFLELFAHQPTWIRGLVTALLLALVGLYLLCACSVTQTMTNADNGSSATVEVNPSQSTSTTLDPNLTIPLNGN